MPLPVIADAYRVAFDWTNSVTTDTATNVMHFHAPGKTSTDVYTALDTNVTTAMWCCVSDLASIAEVSITPLDGSGITVNAFTGSPGRWVGGGGSGDFTPAVCSLVKLLTAQRGRSYRGRVFLPWVAENDTANGTLTGSAVTAGTAAWATWLAAMAGAGVFPGVASYTLASVEPIINILVEPRVATQRRRQVR